MSQQVLAEPWRDLSALADRGNRNRHFLQPVTRFLVHVLSRPPVDEHQQLLVRAVVRTKIRYPTVKELAGEEEQQL